MARDPSARFLSETSGKPVYLTAMKLKRALVLCLIWWSAPIFAQNPEYDFYAEFRSWVQQLRRTDRSLKPDQAVDRYADRLRTEGVASAEIQRRTNLIR